MRRNNLLITYYLLQCILALILVNLTILLYTSTSDQVYDIVLGKPNFIILLVVEFPQLKQKISHSKLNFLLLQNCVYEPTYKFGIYFGCRNREDLKAKVKGANGNGKNRVYSKQNLEPNWIEQMTEKEQSHHMHTQLWKRSMHYQTQNADKHF